MSNVFDGMTTIGNEPLGSTAPLASIAVIGLPGERLRIAPGNDWVGSLAATLTAPALEAGVPVMYAFGPSLPEDAITITPSRAAFVDATASGESGLPNGEPRDMLITSMWFATDHSIASTTTSVEPWQPKTRTE